jgi:hypothetical protein
MYHLLVLFQVQQQQLQVNHRNLINQQPEIKCINYFIFAYSRLFYFNLAFSFFFVVLLNISFHLS